MISSDYKWSFLGLSAIAVLQLLQMVFAARVLHPEELGQWAVLLMMYRLLTPLVEGGWGRAVIREKELVTVQIHTLFTCNVLLGIVVSAALCLCADIISGFFHLSDFNPYVYVFSPIFIAIGFGTIRSNILQRELQFRQIAQIQIFTTGLEFLLFLYLLYSGYRVWSLVLPFVIRFYLQNFAFLLLSRIEIKFLVNLGSANSILRFARFDLGSQLLNYFYTNIDNILVGRLLGQTALGFYVLAWEITVKPVAFINSVILRVVFPLMSKANMVKALYYLTIKRIAIFQIPLYSVLAFAMHWIIEVVYGIKWLPAVDVAVILCGVAVLRAIAEPGASVLAVKGRVDFEFYFQLVNIFVTTAAIFLFYQFRSTIENVGWAMFSAHLLLMSGWLWWIEKNLVRTENSA